MLSLDPQKQVKSFAKTLCSYFKILPNVKQNNKCNMKTITYQSLKDTAVNETLHKQQIITVPISVISVLKYINNIAGGSTNNKAKIQLFTEYRIPNTKVSLNLNEVHVIVAKAFFATIVTSLLKTVFV